MIRKMSDGMSQWSSKMPFPKDRYTVRCIEEEFAPSKAGNPMFTRVFEIVSPSTVEVGEKTIGVAGLKLTQYRTVKVKDQVTKEWDAEKSDKAWGGFRDELLIAGFDPEQEVDDENPPNFFLNKMFDAVIYGKKVPSTKSPTPEQIKKGERYGDVIKDADGNDIVTYQLNLDSIVGPAA